MAFFGYQAFTTTVRCRCPWRGPRPKSFSSAYLHCYGLSIKRLRAPRGLAPSKRHYKATARPQGWSKTSVFDSTWCSFRSWRFPPLWRSLSRQNTALSNAIKRLDMKGRKAGPVLEGRWPVQCTSPETDGAIDHYACIVCCSKLFTWCWWDLLIPSKSKTNWATTLYVVVPTTTTT